MPEIKKEDELVTALNEPVEVPIGDIIYQQKVLSAYRVLQLNARISRAMKNGLPIEGLMKFGITDAASLKKVATENPELIIDFFVGLLAESTELYDSLIPVMLYGVEEGDMDSIREDLSLDMLGQIVFTCYQQNEEQVKGFFARISKALPGDGSKKK